MNKMYETRYVYEFGIKNTNLRHHHRCENMLCTSHSWFFLILHQEKKVVRITEYPWGGEVMPIYREEN